MNLMPCRLINLQQALLGYQKTGVPLISYDGSNLTQTYSADDIGIYILIPKIASYCNISLEYAINIFFYGILCIPTFIALLGFSFYYKQLTQKIIAYVIVALLCHQAYGLGDVYLAYYSCVAALTPWTLYVLEQPKTTYQKYAYFFIMGAYTTFFHYIRSYAGLGMLIFAAILVISNPHHRSRIMQYGLFLIFGSLLATSYFNYCYNSSVNFAKNVLKSSEIHAPQHVLWHSIYIGFGLLKPGNTENIEYDDACGFNKALAINPSADSKKNPLLYESVLKDEVFGLVKNNFKFVLCTVFAKIGIILMYILLYLNIGLLAALWYRKPLYLDCAFFATGCWYSLFPLLTMPTIREYALGLISLCLIYALISINFALQQHLLPQITLWLRLKKLLNFSTAR